MHTQVVPKNTLLSKLDKIVDLDMDILGSILADIVSVGMIRAK